MTKISLSRTALIAGLLVVATSAFAQSTTTENSMSGSAGAMNRMSEPTRNTNNMPMSGEDATSTRTNAKRHKASRKHRKQMKEDATRDSTAEAGSTGVGMSGTSGGSTGSGRVGTSSATSPSTSMAPNPNNVHATPRPASPSNGLYQGK